MIFIKNSAFAILKVHLKQMHTGIIHSFYWLDINISIRKLNIYITNQQMGIFPSSILLTRQPTNGNIVKFRFNMTEYKHNATMYNCIQNVSGKCKEKFKQ